MPFISNQPNLRDIFFISRSTGNYNLASALCDLIDNSINAEATKIYIDIKYNKSKPKIQILDNGKSMSKDKLINSMQVPSSNPEEDNRKKNDLGRFGMGMKSASF